MRMKELISVIERSLSNILDESGSLIYSSIDTLVCGDLYTLGLNPGGEHYFPIRKQLDNLHLKKDNSYLDESWGNRMNLNYKKGGHPLQRNFIGLIKGLGYDPRSVFSSNLIFTRSRRQEGAIYPDRADICWNVHKEFLKIVGPSCLLVFGNSDISPYSYIKSKYSLNEVGKIPSGHGNWNCYHSRGEIEGVTRNLIGLPHLSRYYVIYHKEVINWANARVH